MENTNLQKGQLIVVSGPSGAGKGTVLAHAFEKYPNLRYSVSVTTRAPREKEVDGVDYYFKNIDEYMKMLHDNEFLEHQCVYGNYYGTPRKKVEEMLDRGYDVVLEIDVKGALEIKSRFPEAVMIFITPCEKSTIEERLKKRSTEKEEELMVRIGSALDELKQAEKYDYIVVNEDAEKSADDIAAIIRAEKCSTVKNKVFLNKLIYGGN